MDSYSPSSMMEITSYPFITPTSTVLARATTQFPFAYHPQLPPPSSSSVISSDPSNTTTTATTTTTYDASSKKKRGRPRKYSSDGNNITHMPSFAGHGGDSGGSDSSSTPSTETRVKKRRGRPPGSGKKHLGASGDGEVFEHHVILVESGEDVAERVMAYCLQGSRKLCILSASGLVSNVILQRTPLSSGTATYVGQFNIISLSSFLPQSGNDGEHSSLNVLLAGSDGRVFGGVVGMLTAASPVQIIVGSFVPNGKKSSSNILKSGPSSAPTPKLLYFGGSMSATSPTFQGPSSESYEGNDHSSFRGPELYNNNMQMDHHPLWDGHNLWKMLL